MSQPDIKTKFEQAKAFIDAKDYAAARAVLWTIDHPRAKEWLEKLDKLDLPQFPVAQPYQPPAPQSYAPQHPQQQYPPQPYHQHIITTHSGPGCLVQGLWFIFIGWWLGQLWVGLAWLLMISIIGIPVSILMINALPGVIALRPKTQETVITMTGSQTFIELNRQTPQANLLVRILYFVFVGWWLCGIWIEIAYILSLTIIGMPIGFWMFDKAPSVFSLYRR